MSIESIADLIAETLAQAGGIWRRRIGLEGKEGRRYFLKNNKKIFRVGVRDSRQHTPSRKVFWFFFSKKNCFLMPHH
jgi:hypothetical protein